MRKVIPVVLALIVLSGCGTRRLGNWAPRRPDIPDHKGVNSSAQCAACHDASKYRAHLKTDDCLGCHTTIPER